MKENEIITVFCPECGKKYQIGLDMLKSAGRVEINCKSGDEVIRVILRENGVVEVNYVG